jgi:predicted acylesterase/phospholipase RssA
MRHLLLIFLVATLAAAGCASKALPPGVPATQAGKPVKLALALGGGAARGFAHVGVIKALESQGIVPDIIVGSSAGAVVGALYAAGNNGFELQKLAHRLDETKISDWSLPDRGVLKGEFLQKFVNEAVGQRPLEALNKPFGAVATDLRNGDSVVFRTGNTGMAVRASATVPGVFQPVRINGREYVDGGLSSLIPVRAAREMGADVVIAVDISARPGTQPVTQHLRHPHADLHHHGPEPCPLRAQGGRCGDSSTSRRRRLDRVPGAPRRHPGRRKSGAGGTAEDSRSGEESGPQLSLSTTFRPLLGQLAIVLAPRPALLAQRSSKRSS